MWDIFREVATVLEHFLAILYEVVFSNKGNAIFPIREVFALFCEFFQFFKFFLIFLSFRCDSRSSMRSMMVRLSMIFWLMGYFTTFCGFCLGLGIREQLEFKDFGVRGESRLSFIKEEGKLGAYLEVSDEEFFFNEVKEEGNGFVIEESWDGFGDGEGIHHFTFHGTGGLRL
jgi:hypothetical protein